MKAQKKPLAERTLARWFSIGDKPEDWKKARLDARLVTIPPAVEGVLHHLWDSSKTPAARSEVVRVATRALGTYDGLYPLHRCDTFRMLVVCDWALRCALPLWLDRLPAWCSGRAAAARLRALTAVMWSVQVVDALAALSPVWMGLERDLKDRGTANSPG